MVINGGFLKQDLIYALNGKLYCDLNNNLKSFIKKMFPNVKNDDMVMCEKSNSFKINMTIYIGSERKNISIKTGSSSIVFKDYLKHFILKLARLNVSSDSINSLVAYHFGDGDVYSYGELLREDFKNEIEIVRNEFKNKNILSNLIDQVLIIDKNSKVDYFYYGNVKKGFCISSDVLKYRLLNQNDKYPHRFMKIGPFNYMPQRRIVSLSSNIEIEKEICLLKINNFCKFIK